MQALPVNKYFVFKGYRIHLYEINSQQLVLTIINPNLTKKYASQITTLQNINIDTLISSLKNTNSSCTADIKDQIESLIFSVTVSIPILPSITCTIKCQLLKQISQQQINMVQLRQLKKQFDELKQNIQQMISTKSVSKTKASLVEYAQQPYNEFGSFSQEYGQSYNFQQGVLMFGKLDLEVGYKYILTLSFFADKLGDFGVACGDYANPTILFVRQSTISGKYDDFSFINYTSYVMRDTYSPKLFEQEVEFYVYGSGGSMSYGPSYRNILLTATIIDETQ